MLNQFNTIGVIFKFFILFYFSELLFSPLLSIDVYSETISCYYYIIFFYNWL